MAGLRAIGMVFGGLYLLFVIVVGGGLTWVSMKAKGDIAGVSNGSAAFDSTSESEAERRARRERLREHYADIDREYRQARDGVRIDTDSAAPMVDVERR